MSDQVMIVAQVTVNEGMLEAFMSFMQDAIAAAEDEEGTIGYDWFISEDKSQAHIFERYADSDGALAHMAGFGDRIAGFLTVCAPTSFALYGEPSKQLVEALSVFGAETYTPLGGLSS